MWEESMVAYFKVVRCFCSNGRNKTTEIRPAAGFLTSYRLPIMSAFHYVIIARSTSCRVPQFETSYCKFHLWPYHFYHKTVLWHHRQIQICVTIVDADDELQKSEIAGRCTERWTPTFQTLSFRFFILLWLRCSFISRTNSSLHN